MRTASSLGAGGDRSCCWRSWCQRGTSRGPRRGSRDSGGRHDPPPQLHRARRWAARWCRVHTLLPPGASPHTFEPRPAHVRAVADAAARRRRRRGAGRLGAHPRSFGEGRRHPPGGRARRRRRDWAGPLTSTSTTTPTATPTGTSTPTSGSTRPRQRRHRARDRRARSSPPCPSTRARSERTSPAFPGGAGPGWMPGSRERLASVGGGRLYQLPLGLGILRPPLRVGARAVGRRFSRPRALGPLDRPGGADWPGSTGVNVIFAEPQLSPKAAETIAREIGGQVLLLDPLGGHGLGRPGRLHRLDAV